MRTLSPAPVPSVPSPHQGADACGPAKPVPRHLWMRVASFVASLALVACAGKPPAPEWKMNAKGSAERATEAWLRGDSAVESAEFARVRRELTSTGRPDLLARAELLRCATRVASLVFEPCTGFDALAQDAAPAEQAYARYLAGTAQASDAVLLPEAQRAMLGAGEPESALAGVKDPLSRLVAAGVLLRGGRATPAVLNQAVETASAQGWRRPLAAWLSLQQQRAQAAGAQEESARLQRRIDLLLGTASR